MLILQAISGPLDQQKLLSEFDPEPGTWVVSDLKTKLDIQRRLIETREFLSGESVLRASELWRLLLTRLRPDIQVVSKEFAVTLIAEVLAGRDEEWVRSPSAAETAYQYLCQLMPILTHPQGQEIMAEWFTEHPESQVRWARWFDLAMILWGDFLERGIIAGPWVSGVLINEVGFEQVWDRPLIFDLGAEMNQVEADLIALLSVPVPVTVLQPRPVWREEYKRALLSYELLERKPKLVKTFYGTGDSDPRLFGTRRYMKFTTMLAEVKHACAQAREWLDGTVRGEPGAPEHPSSIAIVAPDIEVYWPTLSAYLEEEGIPCQKGRVARLHSFPDISQWLSTLRLKTGGHAESDLEISLFEREQAPQLEYERFRVLYSAIYAREDLDRSEEIAKMYAIEHSRGDVVTRDEFVAWTLKSLLETAERDRVESLFKRLFQECPESTRLSVQRWLTYLEDLAAKIECKISEGNELGIACINLVSAENSPSTHMIILGLTESALRTGGETAVLFSDISSLAYEFGFHLQSADLAKLEFEARWVIDNSSRHLVLCVPETDFNGAVQAPAWLWVKGAREADIHDVSVPAATRWDEIQRAPFEWLAAEREWGHERSLLTREALEQDLGLRPLPAFAKSRVQTLSASSVEDYLHCPFIFAAKSLFRLSDLPSLDLDVDASTRGKLMHALFERLTREPMRFDLGSDELAAEVEKAREQAAVQIYDQRMWPSLRQRYVDVARRFSAYEKEWRSRFPQTRTLDREADLRGYIDPETGALTPTEPATGGVRFRGSIDRIDVDREGHAAVIDYKSSSSGTAQWGKWIENRELQLALYSLAFESGLTRHPPSEVVSAVYYVARSLDRDKGFKIVDQEQGLYSTDDRKHNKITSSERERLFASVRELLKQVLALMSEGRFRPVPIDVKICRTCQWSSICRAPHLNI